MNRPAACGALLALVALSLSACTADVRTDLTVTSASAASVAVTTTFNGEAGQSLLDNPTTLKQLTDLVAARTGNTPSVEIDKDAATVVVRAPISYPDMAKAAGVLGVGGLTLTGTDTAAVLSMSLVPATELAAAVRTSVKNRPTPDGVANTMLKQTHLVVAVTFPGGVTSATGGMQAGNTVTFTRTADSSATTKVTVTGNPSAPWWTGTPARLLLGALLVGALVAWRRRRTH